MAKYLFVTNTAGITSYDGPSGKRYIINLGLPFEVKDKKDIAFFNKNYRFRKVGKVAALLKKPKPLKDVDSMLKIELGKIEGLSKESAKLVLDTYHSQENLMQAIEQGFNLHESIPVAEQELLKSYFLKDLEEIENPKVGKNKNKKGDRHAR